MDILRRAFDLSYDAVKEFIFSQTENDPEEAHELFIKMCRALSKTGLDRLVLNHRSNNQPGRFELSNAAGFNKNAGIHPLTLKYMGFDRVIIGTVTYNEWQGNPRPRCKRYPGSESLVNWLGLPGIGAVLVADRLAGYGNHGVPLTINLMATPKTKGDELLKDLERTVNALRYVKQVDRFELNISCPNTHGSSGAMDARSEYQSQLNNMLKVCLENMLPHQRLWLKVSPDLDESEIQEIIGVTGGYCAYELKETKPVVAGYTCTNTTSKHKPDFIFPSPGKGGASGPAVYSDSQKVQWLFQEKTQGQPVEFIACGGIGSLSRARDRTEDSRVKGIQIYTAIIFRGPRIIRELRK